MTGVIGVAVEDDEALLAPVENVIFAVLVLLGGSAKKTSRLFLAQDELLSPRRPEFFQRGLLVVTFPSQPVCQYMVIFPIFKSFS